VNKFFKATVLSATLLIPIAIFLFLKFFGDNRFDIPVYYEDGKPDHFKECRADQKEGQYYVQTTGDIQLPATFLFLEGDKSFSGLDVSNIHNRLKESVGPINHVVFSIDSTEGISQSKYLDSSAFVQQMRCNFVTDTVNQFILVDSERKIRGYYNTDREEVDRLIVELKILLENERGNKQ